MVWCSAVRNFKGVNMYMLQCINKNKQILKVYGVYENLDECIFYFKDILKCWNEILSEEDDEELKKQFLIIQKIRINHFIEDKKPILKGNYKGIIL